MGGCNSKDTGAASTSHNGSAVVASSGVTNNNNKQSKPQATSSTTPVKKGEKMVSLSLCVYLLLQLLGYVVRRGGVRVLYGLGIAG